MSDQSDTSVRIESKRNFSFFMIDNEVVDNYNLSANALLVYVSIARCANNGSCSFSLKYLAKQVGLSRATFVRALPEVENSGLLRVDSPTGEQSTYTLLPVKKVHKDQAQIEPTPESNRAGYQAQIEPHKNTNNNTNSKKRRTREDLFLGYDPRTKPTTNTVLQIWAKVRPGNHSPIKPDVALLAERIDNLLKNPHLTPEILIGASRRYLAEEKLYPHSPEFFFGPGKDGVPPWRAYARMEWEQMQRPLAMSAAAGGVQ